ncbi:MAG TPA: glycoside hydrolase family 3 N-terminal domain-containing protein [Vicinamibacterales bacterium]|nr:glycoside hydrolase family 3 N-terminal domain-containing protein [Vicinamibacterales bacterium]
MTAVSVLLAAVVMTASSTPVYQDPARAIDDRVADLLSRMTIEEKIAQLGGVWESKARMQTADGLFLPEKAAAILGQGMGHVARPSEIAGSPTGPRVRSPRAQAEYVNAVQRWVLENTRLKIPVMFHEEALHGFVAPRATSFPVPIALGSSWDPALVERVMTVAAREARARGAQQVLSPVVDLGRDPRWGRFEETYGEDPHLVSRMGVAAVRGYQGTTMPVARDRVIATLKHFSGHGAHEGGINTAPAQVAERLLRSEFFPPFEAGVREAGAAAVMPSYNEIDGVPSHANRWLLEDVLRSEWGFRGVVAGDYFGVDQMRTRHRVAEDQASAAVQALEAGVDIELPDADAFKELAALVKSGRVAEGTIDRAAARVLRSKFAAGLFERPYADPDEAGRLANAPEHRALALEAARRSIVLLQNRDAALPLAGSIRRLAVIGPNARGLRLGGYSGNPGRGVDLLAGITARAGAAIDVLYAEGVRITEDEPNWDLDAVTLGDPARNAQRIAAAVATARRADAIVLAIGTNEATAREAWSDRHLGDVADLALMSQQEDLAAALFALGKPVIVVLINGRPVTMPKVVEKARAVVEAWYAGQEGGTAIAEVLFGDVNPGGKLPVSIPRSVGQLPVYYNRRPTSQRAYVDSTRDPQWPFGFGLSYTTFAISAPTIEPATIEPSESVTVTVEVTNTGARAGDEVVQLYLRDVVSSVTRPVKELRGFERVTLAPGETRTVKFALGPAALALVDRDMKRVVEPGRFEVTVGASSVDGETASFEVVAARAGQLPIASPDLQAFVREALEDRLDAGELLNEGLRGRTTGIPVEPSIPRSRVRIGPAALPRRDGFQFLLTTLEAAQLEADIARTPLYMLAIDAVTLSDGTASIWIGSNIVVSSGSFPACCCRREAHFRRDQGRWVFVRWGETLCR